MKNYSVKRLMFCILYLCFFYSCTNINDVYNKNFNIYSFYEDLTIIENSGLLRQQDTELLKSFIDDKIMNDSVSWLKLYTYKQLYNYAAAQAESGGKNSILDASWKINNSVHISYSHFDAEKGEVLLNFTNRTKRSIKYFRALIKFENKYNDKLCQLDLIYNDTIPVGNSRVLTLNDKAIFKLKDFSKSDLTLIPIIRRIVFTDSTELVNPLSSMFD